MSNIVVIGPGRVGKPLIEALRLAGHEVATLDRQNTESGDHSDLSAFDFAFLTIPDQEISAVAEGVLRRPGRGMIHTSGRVKNSLLGAESAMFHPVMSFRGGEKAEIFKNSPITISAGEQLGKDLETLARDIGGIPFMIEEARKESYHLAAMFASVFPYLLLMTARDLGEKCGIPAARAADLFGPIFRQASYHLAAAPGASGLTGPVSRGDADTLRQHLLSLESDKSLQDLYRTLTDLSIRYANHSPDLTHKLKSAIK